MLFHCTQNQFTIQFMEVMRYKKLLATTYIKNSGLIA